eukprot:45825_1
MIGVVACALNISCCGDDRFKLIACHRLCDRVQQLGQMHDKLISNDELMNKLMQMKRDIMENQEEIVNELNMNMVMELDVVNDSELIVHYSDDLVMLMNDTRLLKEFGYTIGSKVHKGYET